MIETNRFVPVQVYQAIAAYSSRLDNIVEFYGTINLPSLPGLPPVDPIVLTASLKHYFEPVGGSTVSITFEDTEVKGTGGIHGPIFCTGRAFLFRKAGSVGGSDLSDRIKLRG